MEDLQKQIIDLLKVKKEIDPKEEIRISIDFMKDYVKKYPFFKSFVLGISGGQDSTLLGKLAQMASDELKSEGYDFKFIAVKLPYGIQLDEDDVEDALDYIQPDDIIYINIKEAVDSIVGELNAEAIDVSDFNKGNLKARMRMVSQYLVAGENSGIVLGSDQAAENLMGFFTKYGDGSADLMPLYRLNKRQGREILKELNCPKHLYEKIPTADLEDNKPMEADEVQLKVSYEEIDDYLEGKKISEKSRKIIEDTFIKSMHKRHMPINVYDDFWK